MGGFYYDNLIHGIGGHVDQHFLLDRVRDDKFRVYNPDIDINAPRLLGNRVSSADYTNAGVPRSDDAKWLRCYGQPI